MVFAPCGLDLVADGLTKPVLGAAFKRFLENLGMNLPFLQAEDAEVRAAQLQSLRTSQHVHSGAASALSFLLGQALLTEAEALEVQGERDEADPLWIAAVVLMILGAIYAGKLAVQAGQCCLQRLQVWLSPSSEPIGEVQAPLLRSATTNDDAKDDVFQNNDDEAMSLKSSRRSGSCASSGTSRPRSGLEQSTSGAGPVRDNSERKQAHSKRAASSCRSSQVAPKRSETPSVVASVAEALLLNEDYDPAADGLRFAASSTAAGASSSIAADLRRAADGSAGSSAADGRAAASAAAEGGNRFELHNPWNLFQQENKGKGWSPQMMSAMYKKWRSNPKSKMP